MYILNRKLTETTERHVSNTLAVLPVRVYFKDINEIGRSSYGSTDFSDYEKGFCTVYLSLKQNPLEFETTLLHELRHVWQIGSGYPSVCNKVANQVFQTEPQFFASVGAQIQSAVLDLDVIEYLEKQGYSSAIFSAFNDTDGLDTIYSKVTNQSLQDPWSFAAAVLHLYIAYVRADEFHKPTIHKAAKNFPKIIEECKLLEEHISIHLCNDPLYCTTVMGWIIDHFSLWKTYFVVYRGQKIRTHDEYMRFISAR